MFDGGVGLGSVAVSDGQCLMVAETLGRCMTYASFLSDGGDLLSFHSLFGYMNDGKGISPDRGCGVRAVTILRGFLMDV